MSDPSSHDNFKAIIELGCIEQAAQARANRDAGAPATRSIGSTAARLAGMLWPSVSPESDSKRLRFAGILDFGNPALYEAPLEDGRVGERRLCFEGSAKRQQVHT
jgi:hypothetical protein